MLALKVLTNIFVDIHLKLLIFIVYKEKMNSRKHYNNLKRYKLFKIVLSEI